MPKAREFTHEVTSKILPSIRKYGEYKTEAKKTIDKKYSAGMVYEMYNRGYRYGVKEALKTIEEQKYQSFLKGYREGVKDIIRN